MKTVLITGITGQDGSYLAEFLLAKGCRVCGTVRRASSENCQRIEHLRERIQLYQADLLDQVSINTFMRWRCKPGFYTKVVVPITYTMQGAQL